LENAKHEYDGKASERGKSEDLPKATATIKAFGLKAWEIPEYSKFSSVLSIRVLR
jgi:hypothetical protein